MNLGNWNAYDHYNYHHYHQRKVMILFLQFLMRRSVLQTAGVLGIAVAVQVKK